MEWIILLEPYLMEYGYVALFIMFFLGIIGFPLPEETLLVLSGVLVYSGHFSYIPTILISFFGTTSAMTLAYFIGRKIGYPFFHQIAPRFGFRKNNLAQTEKWFGRIGKFAIPLGYFIPGIRQFTAYFAGITRLPLRDFLFLAYGGGLAWSFIFVTLGMKVGENWKSITEKLSDYFVIGAAVIIVLLFLCYSFLKKRNLQPGVTVNRINRKGG